MAQSDMQPFAHLGSRALDRLKGLIPQPNPAPPEPIAMPKSPNAPEMFTRAPEMGPPNIPDYSVGDVANDDSHPLLKMENGPSVLEGLRAAGGMNDPSGKLFMLQDKLRDELAGNLAKAKGAGSAFMTGGTQADLDVLNRDLDANPVSIYQKQKQDFQDKQYQASLGGFKTPQDAAAFARMLEAKKVSSPSDVAGIQAAGNLEVQKAKDAGYEGFFDKLMGMNAAGMPPGVTMRGPGGVGLTTAPVSPGAASNAEKSIEQLTRELHALENPSMLGPIPMENPFADKARLIAAKRAELAAAQARATGRPMQAAPTPQDDPRRSEATRLLSEAGQPVTEANINHVMQQLH